MSYLEAHPAYTTTSDSDPGEPPKKKMKATSPKFEAVSSDSDDGNYPVTPAARASLTAFDIFCETRKGTREELEQDFKRLGSEERLCYLVDAFRRRRGQSAATSLEKADQCGGAAAAGGRSERSAAFGDAQDADEQGARPQHSQGVEPRAKRSIAFGDAQDADEQGAQPPRTD